jgi:tetratricopeptide (TPR) repeat protein
MLAELLAASGRFDEARRTCEAVPASSPELALGIASYAGAVEFLAGDAPAAERRFRDGWWNPVDLAADRADCLYRVGRYGEADRLASFTEATAPAYDVQTQARWRRMRAKLLARAGEAATAGRLAREAVALADRCEAPNVQADARVDLAEVLGRSGREEESSDALAAALRLYEKKGNVASAERAAGLLREKRSARSAPVLPSPAA